MRVCEEMPVLLRVRVCFFCVLLLYTSITSAFFYVNLVYVSVAFSGDGSRSSPDEALVTRWVIVTDKRMLHAQEEPGWGADKEKVKTLDLVRYDTLVRCCIGYRRCIPSRLYSELFCAVWVWVERSVCILNPVCRCLN